MTVLPLAGRSFFVIERLIHYFLNKHWFLVHFIRQNIIFNKGAWTIQILMYFCQAIKHIWYSKQPLVTFMVSTFSGIRIREVVCST